MAVVSPLTPLFLLVALLAHNSRQCFSTTDTTTPQPPTYNAPVPVGPGGGQHAPEEACNRPDDTAGIILIGVSEEEKVYEDDPKGSCSCVGYRKYFYPSNCTLCTDNRVTIMKNSLVTP